MIGLPENNPNGDATPGDIAGDALPDRREALFAPPRRVVVPRPVYRHKLLKALSSGLRAHLEVWSVERVLAALLFIFAFGVLGVFTADTFLCPEGHGCPLLGRMPLRGYRLRSWGWGVWPCRLCLSPATPFPYASTAQPALICCPDIL